MASFLHASAADGVHGVDSPVPPPPVLLEKTYESMTLIWPNFANADKYTLQIKEEEGGEEGGDPWKTLSSALISNSVKKKNLYPGKGYLFRYSVKQIDKSSFSSFSPSLGPVFVLDAATKQMDCPELKTCDSSSVTIQWKEVSGSVAEGYRIRYRQDDQLEWSTVDTTIKGTSVKKKGLLQKTNYFFSVKPVGTEFPFEFSPSSTAMQISTIPPYIKQIMPKELISRGVRVKSEEALEGKVIGIYFSAHWCGPCRNYTPQLAAFYNQAKAAGKNFEVVFASCDHDESSAMAYFKESHPWTMIPYDDSERETLSATFRVSGIPRLVILSGNTDGHVLVDNAVGASLSLATLEKWENMK